MIWVKAVSIFVQMNSEEILDNDDLSSKYFEFVDEMFASDFESDDSEPNGEFQCDTDPFANLLFVETELNENRIDAVNANEGIVTD